MVEENKFLKALEFLGSTDPDIRKKALVALARSGEKRALRSIKEVAVSDPDTKVRHYARRALDVLRKCCEDNEAKQNTSSAEAVEKSISMLQAGDAAARQQACLDIVENGDEAHAELLAKRLSMETDPFVIATLAKSLGSLGGVKWCRELLPLLRHEDDRIAANAVEGLVDAGDPEIVPHLAGCLSHGSNRVRANAIRALRDCSSVNTLYQLCIMLKSGNLLARESAVYVLNELVSEQVMELYRSALADTEPRVRQKAVDGLQTLMKEAYSAVTEVKPSETVGFDADDEMDFVEAPTEVPVERDGTLKILLEKSDDPPSGTKSTGVKHTTSRYLRIDRNTVTEEAEPEDDEYSSVDQEKKRVRLQLKAIFSAAESGDVNKVTDFASKLSNTTNPILRSALLFALSKLGDSGFADLISNYLNDDDARVRADAIEALERIQAPDLMKRLKPMLSDPAARVKANAIVVLGKFPDFDVETHVKDLLASRSPRVRRSGIFVIKKLGGDKLLRLLEPVLEDPVAKVRMMVLQTLKESWRRGSRTAHSLLKEAKGIDKETREMLDLYNRLPEMSASELADIAMEGDYYIRKQAVLQLVKHKGPEAEKALDSLEKARHPSVAAIIRTARKSRS